MYNLNFNDTIVAIATPLGESGIGIVRFSGKDALKIADKIFLSKDKRKPSEHKTYTIHYGWVIRCSSALSLVLAINQEPTVKGFQIIDEVLLTVMRAPRTYTKEDIVEINCHGGIVATRAVLELVLENGARLAEPGEFTKRAFLNGRIDLAQAEAVLDIIRAKTDSALAIGMQQLRGGLSRRIGAIRQELIVILGLLEANIDFPEEDVLPAGTLNLKEKLGKIKQEIKNLLEGSRRGRILREGIHVVICGKPNVGKSSLLNALLKRERSIVTPVAGTTRDTIEEIIDIKGIPVRIVDTAGIIEPRDLIEKEAVKRAKQHIKLADLVILLFDGTKGFSREDELLIRKTKGKHTLAIINKIDLRQKINKERLLKIFKHLVSISAKKRKNIHLLEEAISNLFYSGKISAPEPATLSNLRHIQAIRDAEKLIAEAGNSLDNNLSWEFVSQDMKEALEILDGILGRDSGEELLDKIFSEFCIGK